MIHGTWFVKMHNSLELHKGGPDNALRLTHILTFSMVGS